jgi:LAO/AO transport system kinase
LDLLVDLKKGKRGAIAKAISIVENDQTEAKKLLKKIFKSSGNSTIIGITGPAGAWQLTLQAMLLVELYLVIELE